MIIILNGPINSGKTTVAKILWKKIPNTAHIEVDNIRKFIDWMANEQAWGISFDTALSVAKEFIKKNLNVIITYHISDKGFKKIKENLEPLDKDIFAFTLLPKFDLLLKNRGNRDLNDWERGRIKETHQLKSHQVNYGETIDNSHQTPQQTADYIFNKIKTSLKKHTIVYPRRK